MAIVICSEEEMYLDESNPVSVWTFPDYVVIKEQFCKDPDDNTFVTIGLGGGTEITKAELKTRALDIHTRYPFQQPNPLVDPEILVRTDAEVETMVDDWCTSKNVS
tara:strand:+ start:12742 stop:13059 length:318 start_codon:yes stop_codon:yes gene_type:complete